MNSLSLLELKSAIAILITVLFLNRIIELRVKRELESGRVVETRTLGGFVRAGTFYYVAAMAEFFFRAEAIFWIPFFIGLVFQFASIFLRKSAIRALGRHWSFHIEIRERHPLVNEGPFRWIRHPAYASMILEYVGTVLMLQCYIAFGLAMVLLLPTYITRIREEEKALLESLGETYARYRETTPMLIPYRLPPKVFKR